jgi:hypothetical protein
MLCGQPSHSPYLPIRKPSSSVKPSLASKNSRLGRASHRRLLTVVPLGRPTRARPRPLLLGQTGGRVADYTRSVWTSGSHRAHHNLHRRPDHKRRREGIMTNGQRRVVGNMRRVREARWEMWSMMGRNQTGRRGNGQMRRCKAGGHIARRGEARLSGSR